MVESSKWYDTIGVGYNDLRRPDARIGAPITAALGDARTILDVGAGTGAYEPAGRELVALEPSWLMLGGYRGRGLRVQGIAENLPFDDGSFDAAMASLTMHHWRDWRAGLGEMVRVARDTAVIFTHDPDMDRFWLFDYFPDIHVMDLEIFEPLTAIESCVHGLGRTLESTPVPVPHDCSDGFLGAYWRRPEAYLQGDVRRAISTFNRLAPDRLNDGLAALARDIESGRWRSRYGSLLARESLDIGYRVLRISSD